MEYAASLDSIKVARVTIAPHAAVTPVSKHMGFPKHAQAVLGSHPYSPSEPSLRVRCSRVPRSTNSQDAS
jgi:hypothetical protein